MVELDDEVDYIITPQGEEDIRAQKALIQIKRLYDHKLFHVHIDRLEKALQNKENIDYLDKK